MSKEFENMDDLFQSAFADESAQVPAFVKESIDKRLGFTKRKKGWMFWTGGVMLLTIAAIFIFNKQDDALDQNQASQMESSDDKSDQHMLSGTYANETQNAQKNNDPINENINSQNEKLNPSTSEQNEKNEQKVNTENRDTNSKKKTGGNISESYLNTDYSSEGATIAKTETGSTSKTDGEEKTNKLNGTSGGAKSGEDGYGYANNPVINLRKNSLFTSKQVNPFVSASHLKISQPQGNKIVTANHPSAITIDSEETIIPWMITFTGGLDFSKSTYSSPITDEADMYNNTTTAKPGYHLNIGTTYSLKNGIQLGSGAGISIFSENYHYEKSENLIDTTYTWLIEDIYEYDSLLDTTIWVGVDSTLNTNYDTTFIQLYDETGETKATYLQIPLSVGYQFRYKKFLFDIAFAGRFNYLLKGSGAYIANDLVQKFDNTSGQIYKKMYFDFIIQTTVHYRLTEHLYISGSFKYRPAVGNIYQNVGFNRTLQSFQLGAGLSWKF
ncbi:MAG: outer membrane beta-barrel protein [Crocinitomicaceae bacterium]|nr:outer membrane beta-barrel protein [Crocinitomicaceae bacterium]